MLTEDYLNFERYKNRPASSTPGFSAFQDEQTSSYYFAMLDDSANVLLISEAYPTETARDNGIKSVINNRDLDERYQLKTTTEGKYYLSLSAANFQEIAISDFFDTEAEARAILPSERKKAAAALAQPTAGTADDDYLNCSAYKGHQKSSYEGFTTFRHNNGLFYFAMIDDEENVILRSEGYSSESARNNGIQSVIKNKDIPERYRTRHFTNGTRIISLFASNKKEIARSCPIDDEQGLFGLFPLLAPPAISLSGTKEDDYLACHEYTGFEADENGIARFEKNGQHYFVWYDNAGKVLLRSEGFESENDLQSELDAVLKYRYNDNYYEHIDKAGYRIKILKDENGREVGRSCAEKFVAAVPPPVAAAAPSPPPVVPAAAAAEGGFKWWWILLPLLLLALFFWWKGCQKKPEEAATPAVAPVDTAKATPMDTMAAIKVDTTSQPAAPEVKTMDDKVRSMIFFDFDKAELTSEATADLDRLVGALNSNSEFKVKLNAYTDAKGSDAYNAALSRRRANATKAYLVSKGIAASRIETSTFGEKDPIAKNTLADGTDTEAGRRFNRRVEISILRNGEKTDIEEKVDVPADLKE